MKRPGTFLLLIVLICVFHGDALENGMARTPPMGWNSWATYACAVNCSAPSTDCVSEALYRQVADYLASEGYLKLGYEYVNIDDCWMSWKRTWNKELTPNATRFPSGMKALSNYIHSKGLKLGIYEAAGLLTCQRYPGSYKHTWQDAKTFDSWGIDYVKFDACHIRGYDPIETYMNMSDAIVTGTRRGMVYSNEWPLYFYSIGQENTNDYKVISEYSNLWRNYVDVSLCWFGPDGSGCVGDIIRYYTANQHHIAPYVGPGHWSDPDMLVIGNPGFTDDQNRVQISLWAMWSAPLIFSAKIQDMTPVHKEILQNSDVIAIDQDPLGHFAFATRQENGITFYVKKLQGYNKAAVAIYNENNFPLKVKVKLDKSIGFPFHGHNLIAKDVWNYETKNFSSYKTFIVNVPATGVVLYRIAKKNF